MSLFWKIAKWLAFVWLALFVIGFLSAAFAQALPVGVSPVFAPSYAGNAVTFSGGTATAANAASLKFGNAANGAVYAEQKTALALSGGRTAVVTARSAPSAASVAGAIGRYALKLGRSAAVVVGVGLATYELAKELGFTMSRSEDGAIAYGKIRSVVETQCHVEQHTRCKSYLDAGMYPGATCSYDIVNGVCRDVMHYTNGTIGVYQYWSPATSQGSQVVPATPQEFEDAIANKPSWPAGSKIGDALRDAVASGEPLPLPAPNQITGPSTVPGVPRTVTNPDGSTETVTPRTDLEYGPDSVTMSDTFETTGTDANGDPVAPKTETGPTELPQTCGYPGGPACKIDETGTPEADPLTESATKPGMDGAKVEFDGALTRVTGDSDKGWAWAFLDAPPIAACESLPLPSVMGVEVPNLDPCTTVDGIRAVMAWLWAFAGFYACIGFVREVI